MVASKWLPFSRYVAIQADVAIKSMDGNTLLDSWGLATAVGS